MENTPTTFATRTCTKCGVENPLEEFYLERKTGQRRRSVCRQCSCAARRRQYAERKVRLGKTARRWRHSRPGTTGAFTRVCTTCGREKPSPEFYLLDPHTGRRSAECRACRRAYHRRYWVEHAEEARLRHRAWRRAHPDLARELARRSRHKARQRAQAETRRLRDLGVVRQSPTCIECGASPTVLHHESYDDLVNVLSLCRRCHMLRHYAQWRKTGGGPIRHPWEYDDV